MYSLLQNVPLGQCFKNELEIFGTFYVCVRTRKYVIFQRMVYHHFQAQAVVNFEKYSHCF